MLGQTLKPIVGWRYIATRDEFWTQIIKDSEAKDYLGMVNQAMALRSQAKEDAERNEANLALAKGLRGMGFLQSAFFLFTDLVDLSPGSFAAFEALRELSGLVPEGSFDEELLSRAINKNSWSELPDSVMSMVGYYLATDLAARGMKSWLLEPAKAVRSGTYWSQRMDFYRAIELVGASKPDDASAAFAAVEASPVSGQKLQRAARLHRARLLFEKAEYEEAEKLYSTFNYAGRDGGQVLFERAWNQYYLHDYSLTMGLLEAIKSPYFLTSIEPEQFVLASVVLRDLCHYPAIKAINREFFATFGETIEWIRQNKDLEKSSVLMSMVLVRDPFRSLADTVDSTQKERARLVAKFGLGSQLGFLIDRSERVAKEIKGRMSRRIDARLRNESGRLLETADQMKLLDYISGLDENRIQQMFESRQYQAKAADTLRFNKLYWPQPSISSGSPGKRIRKEFWFDELPNLRMLVADRCEGAKKR